MSEVAKKRNAMFVAQAVDIIIIREPCIGVSAKPVATRERR
jgi:hypothetical protein